jgi:hypothetical protein
MRSPFSKANGMNDVMSIRVVSSFSPILFAFQNGKFRPPKEGRIIIIVGFLYLLLLLTAAY